MRDEWRERHSRAVNAVPVVEIDEGRFVDLIEIDAASKTKVDDTRDLLDNVQYAPARGRYKIYLMDEVHMLSKSSFNALLKTLEEPPPHVKFLLATTDPQKLPVTVLSRCLQFNLKRMTPRLISERLTHICEAEGIEAESAALATLARAADGSMRDALSLLDQAIAYCGGTIQEAAVARMLGTIDRDHVARLLRLLADNDAKAIVDAIREIDEQFPNYSRLLEDLARDLQRIAVFQVVGTLDSEDDLDEQEIEELATAMSPADVQLFYQVAVLGRRDLHLAPDPRSGAEMTLLRMLSFRPAHAGETAGGGGGAVPAPKSVKSAKAPARKAVQATPEQTAATANWDDPDWSELVTGLGLSGAVRLLASNCAYNRREGKTLYLGLDPRSESLLTRQRQAALAEALSARFGESLNVEIEIGSEGNETPLQEESRLADERMEEERQKLAESGGEGRPPRPQDTLPSLALAEAADQRLLVDPALVGEVRPGGPDGHLVVQRNHALLADDDPRRLGDDLIAPRGIGCPEELFGQAVDLRVRVASAVGAAPALRLVPAVQHVLQHLGAGREAEAVERQAVFQLVAARGEDLPRQALDAHLQAQARQHLRDRLGDLRVVQIAAVRAVERDAEALGVAGFRQKGARLVDIVGIGRNVLRIAGHALDHRLVRLAGDPAHHLVDDHAFVDGQGQRPAHLFVQEGVLDVGAVLRLHVGSSSRDAGPSGHRSGGR